MLINKINNFSNFKNTNQNKQNKSIIHNKTAEAMLGIGFLSTASTGLLLDKPFHKNIATVGMGACITSVGIDTFLIAKELNSPSSSNTKTNICHHASRIFLNGAFISTIQAMLKKTTKQTKTGLVSAALCAATSVGLDYYADSIFFNY